jgi:MYXO-CTERM domain-containing protein
VNASVLPIAEWNVYTPKKYKMRKLTKTFFAVMFFYSLTIATPLPAQNETNNATSQRTDRNDDDSGKWGLVGLIGLFGLLGLRKKDYDNRTRTTRTP